MNIDGLNMVADALDVTKNYNQEYYTNSCGTPACVAGHTVMVLDKEFIKFRLGFDGIFYFRGNPDSPAKIHIAESARKLLELNRNQAGSLFSAFPLRGKIVTRQMAASVLRLLATDGIVRWERFQ